MNDVSPIPVELLWLRLSIVLQLLGMLLFIAAGIVAVLVGDKLVGRGDNDASAGTQPRASGCPCALRPHTGIQQPRQVLLSVAAWEYRLDTVNTAPEAHSLCLN